MKLSEEYFQKNIVDKNDYSFDLIKTYGLIREIEGKRELAFNTLNDQCDDPEYWESLVLEYDTELTTIRKKAGL